MNLPTALGLVTCDMSLQDAVRLAGLNMSFIASLLWQVAPIGSAANAATVINDTVVAWGPNLPSTASLTNIAAISSGILPRLAVKGDGRIVLWGSPNPGDSNAVATLSNIVAVAGGNDFSLALGLDGTVIGWGENSFGQVTIPAYLTNVIAIAAGDFHGMALRSDGTVAGWGVVTPPGGLTGVEAIACGSSFSLALKSDGTVVGWGSNYHGESTPPSGVKGVVALAAGATHSLAALSNGTVVAWGDSTLGATDVPQDLTGVIAVAAGQYFSVALTSDGTVRAWGRSDSGQTSVPADLNDVVAISAGPDYSLALVNNRRLPPRILVPPQNQVAVVGGNASFSVIAKGTGPLSYKWFRGSTSIAMPGGPFLSLDRVQPSAAGNYSVVVSNPYGAVTSSVGVLTVTTVMLKRTYVVSNPADSGPGSLRQAILDANATRGGDIVFSNLTGSIYLVSPLPPILGSTTLSGPGLSLLRITAGNIATAFYINSDATS